MRMVAAWLQGNFFFFFFVFLFPSLRIWTPFFFYYQLRCKCDCLYERFGNVVGFFSSVNGSFKQAFTLIFDFWFFSPRYPIKHYQHICFFFFPVCLFLRKCCWYLLGVPKDKDFAKEMNQTGLGIKFCLGKS